MKATHTTTNSAARMTLTGLFAAMITLMTAYICHIPYGANGGYIHFGDALKMCIRDRNVYPDILK